MGSVPVGQERELPNHMFGASLLSVVVCLHFFGELNLLLVGSRYKVARRYLSDRCGVCLSGGKMCDSTATTNSEKQPSVHGWMNG